MASSLAFSASEFPVPAGTNPECPKKDLVQKEYENEVSDVRAAEIHTHTEAHKHTHSIHMCLWTHRHADTLTNCCPPVCPGFDLCEVGQEEVVLKTGKLANRRTLHFALQSLLALFGKYTDLLLFIV